jgi:predicted alpha/beta-hydrolase family hydrolase
LVFFGFPLHPAGKPSTDRAAHLSQISVPMLFVQGTRDTLADHSLLRPLVESLPLATLEAIEGADHSFHVPARSGRTDAQVRAAMVETLLAWSAKTKV